MIADHLQSTCMNVGGRLEPGERGPEKVHGAGGSALDFVTEHHQWPVAKSGRRSDPRSQSRILLLRSSTDDETTRAEHLNVTDTCRKVRRAELGGKLSDRLAQPHPDSLGSFVDLRSCVVQGIHSQIAEDEKVRFRMCTSQNVLQDTLEISQVEIPIHQQQELGQRQLAFTENPKGAGHGLALVPFLDHCRSQRMVPSFTVRPQILHSRHHEWKQRCQKLLQ